MNFEEFLNIVDNEDNIIGIETREKIDESGTKNYRVIHILIFSKDNKILLPIRSSSKNYCPNCYEFSVGGHVQANESYEKAAYRELEEELNIKNVKLEEIKHFSPYELNISSFTTLYKLVYDGPLKIAKNEIESVKYVSINNLKDLVIKSPNKCTSDFVEIISWLTKNNYI